MIRTGRTDHRIRQGRRRSPGAGRIVALLVLLATLLPLPAGAAGDRILLIRSGDNAVYQEVLTSMKEGLLTRCRQSSPTCSLPAFEERLLDDGVLDDLSPRNAGRWRLIVTVGMKAAQTVESKPLRVPVLNTLIPRSAMDELGLARDLPGRHSAVFIDQPIQRQVRLVRSIRPARRTLGLLLGPATMDRSAGVVISTREIGIKLQTRQVSEADQVGQAVRRILAVSDVLLALPDPLVYNRRTIVNIMLSSYHSRVPVIGFSAAYVKSGAIAAVYSTPEDIGRHVSDIIWRFLNRDDGQLPAPEYPRYFHVETNTQVAHSLGIQLPPAPVIRRRLESMEGQ